MSAVHIETKGTLQIDGDVVGRDKIEGDQINIYHYGEKKERPAPRMAPPAPRVFIGRDEVLRELIAALKLGEDGAGPIALTALKGMGGIGKTTLAAALANHPEVETALPEGTLWAGLGPEPEVMSLLAEWGAQLGEDFSQFDSPEARSRRLSSLLREKKTLLIVDDVWQVDSARYFLVGGTYCRALITTRDNEIARKLAGHEAVRVETLTNAASLNLLRELAREAVEADENAANELATVLDGLPLALTLAGQILAAEWEAGLGVAGALSELKDREARLQLAGAEKRPGLSEASSSLRAVLAMSYDHLPNEETKRAFRFLSTFGGKPLTFTLEAMAYILRKETTSFRDRIAKRLGMPFLHTWEEIDPNSIRRIIAILVQRALVDPMKNGRYALHTILADLAESLLEMNGEAEITRHAHMNYYLKLAQQNAEQNWQTIETEMEQIQRGFCSAHSVGGCQKVFDYRWAMRTFFTRRGLWDRYLEWTRTALCFAQAIRAFQIEATLINDIGFIYKNKSQYDKALKYYMLSRKLYNEIDDQNGLAVSLINIGGIYIDQGAWDEALQCLKRSMVITKKIGKLDLVATIFDNIGNVYLRKGDWDRALVYFTRGRDIWEKIDDRTGLAIALTGIGEIYKRQGSWNEAIEYYESGRKILDEIGDIVALAPVLNNIGRIYADKGCLDDAMNYYTQCQKIQEKIHDEAGLAVLLTNMGRLYIAKGMWDQAFECQKRSCKICKEIGDAAVLAESLNNIGYLYAYKDSWDEALKYYDQSRLIREDIGDQAELAMTIRNIGDVYQRRSMLDKALEYYEQSRVILEKIKDRRELARTLNDIGVVYHDKCNWDGALKCFIQSSEVFEELNDQSKLAYTLWSVGHLYMHQKQLNEAEQALTRAVTIFEALKSQDLKTVRKQLERVRKRQRKASQK